MSDDRTMTSIENAVTARRLAVLPGFGCALSRCERQALGRFDTPRPFSQALTDWAIRSGSDTVFEPSAGGGSFVFSALYRLRRLGAVTPEHLVWACDIDARAIERVRQSAGLPDAHVWTSDVLDLIVSECMRDQRFTVLIGNPPYVSLHAMSVAQRMSAQRLMKWLGQSMDRRASLWAYVLLGGIHLLADGGRIAVILPQAALHAGYARNLMHGIGRRFRTSMLVRVQ